MKHHFGKSTTELEDVVVEEVSLVMRGANKRDFILIKSDQFGGLNMDEFLKLLKELFGSDLDEKEQEVVKSLPDDFIASHVKEMKVLAKYRKDMPEEVWKSFETLVCEFPVVKMEHQSDQGDELKTEKGEENSAEEISEDKGVEKEDDGNDKSDVEKNEDDDYSVDDVLKGDNELVEISTDDLKKSVSERTLELVREKGYKVPETVC